MSFRVSNKATSLLQRFCDTPTQSRALLLIGKNGWGKFSSGIDFAENILGTDPLQSSDFFCFRNDQFALKTEYFLTKTPATKAAWDWIYLLQRRINVSLLIGESLGTGAKIATTKDDLDSYIAQKEFPQDKKFMDQLLTLCGIFDKKTGVPIDIIREISKFHAMHSDHGRVSLIGNFDQADETTQNAALKLLEEPHPNHWLILTAENEKNIIQTIKSRTVKIVFTEPSAGDLAFLGSETHPLSATNIMKESLYKISQTKKALLKEFFDNSINQVDQNIHFLQFIETLVKEQQTDLFLESLQQCFEDAFILRQNHLRNLSIPLKIAEYQEFSSKLQRVSTTELEEFVSLIGQARTQVARSVIKVEAFLPPLFLEIARTLIKIK
ncbi:MAG: hypothetical protein ACRCS8_01520 [Brevinema sp.]